MQDENTRVFKGMFKGAPVPGCVRRLEHGPSEGCYRCCDLCSYDQHQCPGCGVPLAHGINACASCMAL